MKIHFMGYTAEEGILKFSATNFKNSNQQFEFQKKFLTHTKLILSLDINIKQGLYFISPFIQRSEVELFLKDTKKIFLDFGVNLKNWEIFQKTVIVNANIPQSQKAVSIHQLPDVLLAELDKYLSLPEKPKLWRTNQFFNKTLCDYQKLLKLHLPEDYKKSSAKKQPPNYHQLFDQAMINYKGRLKYVGKHNSHILYPLFKVGDLNNIIKVCSFNLKDFVQYDDYYDGRWQGLLTWAYFNNHQHILDYFFNYFLSDIHKINFNLLEWGIFCYQTIDVLKTLRRPNDFNNALRESKTKMIFNINIPKHDNALSLAGFCGNIEAVEYLFPESNPLSRQQCAYFAAKNDRLNIVQYLYNQGVRDGFCHIPEYKWNKNIPMLDIRHESALYLISQPEFLLTFIQNYPNISDNLYSFQNLYYKRIDVEPTIPEYVAQNISQWLTQVDEAFEPIQIYFKQHMQRLRQKPESLVYESLLANMLLKLPHRDPIKITNILEKSLITPIEPAFVHVLKRVKDNMLTVDIPEESATKKFKR